MKFILPAILILVASCSSEIRRPAAPDDLIPRDTMVLIMHDLVVIEGHIEIKYNNVNNYHALAIKSGNKLLKKFRVSPERFERSYDYYVGHQEKLQSIYSEVLDSLNKEVNEMKAKGIKSGTFDQNSITIVDPFK